MAFRGLYKFDFIPQSPNYTIFTPHIQSNIATPGTYTMTFHSSGSLEGVKTSMTSPTTFFLLLKGGTGQFILRSSKEFTNTTPLITANNGRYFD